MSAMEQKTLNKEDLVDEVCVVVGTRPGIVMFAPIIHELRDSKIPFFILHTGQHYSPNMDSQFFKDLNLPEPDYRIEGVSDYKTHGGQTAKMLTGTEEVLMKRRPKVVIVGGDANTNLAAALAARKLQMVVVHLEAGMRSYDWRMPEEHNRTIIDHISDILLASDETAVKTLKEEKIRGRILNVGNPIVDASLQNLKIAEKKSTILSEFGLDAGKYFLMTSHREENVDNKKNLQGALEGVSRVAQIHGFPAVFLAHPRTEKRLMEFGLREWAETLPNIRIHPAVGYLDFIYALSKARLFFTDSGGGQQEACIHHVPCVTLRENTEWVDTITVGANRLAGCDPNRIAKATEEALTSSLEWDIPFGDGTAARQIAVALREAFTNPPQMDAYKKAAAA